MQLKNNEHSSFFSASWTYTFQNQTNIMITTADDTQDAIKAGIGENVIDYAEAAHKNIQKYRQTHEYQLTGWG